MLQDVQSISWGTKTLQRKLLNFTFLLLSQSIFFEDEDKYLNEEKSFSQQLGTRKLWNKTLVTPPRPCLDGSYVQAL